MSERGFLYVVNRLTHVFRYVPWTERSLLFRRLHKKRTGKWRAVTDYPIFMWKCLNIHFRSLLAVQLIPFAKPRTYMWYNEVSYYCTFTWLSNLTACLKRGSWYCQTPVLQLMNLYHDTLRSVSVSFTIRLHYGVAHSGYGIPGPMLVQKLLLMAIISGPNTSLSFCINKNS